MQTGRYIIIAGLVIVVVGVIVYFFHNKLQWLGRLPGDIRIERENRRVYIPLTTMLLLSITLSILLHLIKKFI